MSPAKEKFGDAGKKKRLFVFGHSSELSLGGNSHNTCHHHLDLPCKELKKTSSEITCRDVRRTDVSFQYKYFIMFLTVCKIKLFVMALRVGRPQRVWKEIKWKKYTLKGFEEV